MNCPACGGIASLAGAKFCEDCGAPLSPSFANDSAGAALGPATSESPSGNATTTDSSSVKNAGPCPNCGAGAEAIDSAGFCAQCGLERHRPTDGDHWELVISPALAGVCDLGLKRLRNEDFMALAEEGALRVAVLCDGISQSRDADRAASAGAGSACAVLVEAVRANGAWYPAKAMHAALDRAQVAVAVLGQEGPQAEDAPATTIVAALASQREVLLGWLGDCRAYWVGAAHGDARLLTKDHSWVNDVVDAGKLTYAEALRRKGAHTVTRSLGGPAPDPSRGEIPDEPSILRAILPDPGWLLLCSDGLWGYAPEPAEIAVWIGDASDEKTDAATLARRLVERAGRCGGRDNATAVLIRF